MVNDRIIAFLENNGPSLPVEISKAIGYESFITKAILLELTNKGVVKKTKRPIGGSLLYYLPNQESRMRERLQQDLGIPDRKVLDKLSNLGRVSLNELEPHDRAFINSLLDFITVEQVNNNYYVTHHSYKPTEVRVEVKETPVKSEPLVNNETKITKDEPVKEPEISVKEPEILPIDRELKLFDNSAQVVKTTDAFDKKVRKYLDDIGSITNSTKIKSNLEYDYSIKITKPLTQELLVKAKNKKSINETDLSLLYAQALHEKKPAILITNGKLTIKAKKWKEANTGNLIQVIEL